MTNLETKKERDIAKRIAELVDLLISRTVNEIQTRAVNLFAALKTLGLTQEQIITELENRLDDQSEKVFELFASQAGNVAINEGRYAELLERKDEIQYYIYSAILDNATCGPCEDADGQESTNIDDLPDAPLQDCEGMAACRCAIVGVGKEENA